MAIAVLIQAIDAGITFIDTADAYCIDETDKHHNERLIAKALSGFASDVKNLVIATKGGFIRPSRQWVRNSHPGHLRDTIRESYLALGGKRPISLWQHHAPDPEVPVEVSLAVAATAVKEGLIRHVGVSNYSVPLIERARNVIEIVSVQNQYSPWHRKPEADGVISYCEREGITFIPWSPLGGDTRSKHLGEYDILTTLAREKNASPHQIVLAWVRSKSPCILPIPGSTRPEHVIDNVAALNIMLSVDEIRRIDTAIPA